MTESEPLLVLDDSDDAPEDEFDDIPRPRRTHPYLQYFRTTTDAIRDHLKAWKDLYLCAWLIVALEIPLFMSTAPGLQLMENAVCYKIYGDSANHDLCQQKNVQTKLAEVRGVLAVLAAIPSLLLAVPYGMLADSKGRKFVVGMTVFAALCCYIWTFLFLYFHKSVPFALIYVYPLFLWVGGGGFVAGSIITAIAADVVPNEESRTRAFFLLGVIGRLVGVAAPPIGARIMHYYGPNFAFFLTIPISIIPLIPLVLLPETASPRKKDNSSSDEDEELNGPSKKPTIKMRIDELKQHIKKDFVPLLKSVPICIGLISYVIGSFATGSGEIIMQYIKVRFGWNYEKATNVVAFAAGMQIIFLCTLLPVAHRFLTNRYATKKADLVMTKISIIFDFISPLIFAFSAKPVGAWIAVAIGCFGIGFGGALRAYLTAIVPKHDIALLYTLIGTAGAIGSLFAAPLLQLCLAAGIKVGGMLLGLPYFVIAAVYGLNTILIWCLRSPRTGIVLDDDVPSEDGLSI